MIPCSSCILFSQWMFTRLCHDRFHMSSLFLCVQHQKVVSDVPYLLHHKQDRHGCASLSGKEENLRGWHWAVSVRRVRGVKESSAFRGWWAWRSSPGQWHSPKCRRPRSIWTVLWDIVLHFGCSCAEPGVGLDGPCGSLPTQDVLWFCEKEICYAWARTGSQKMSFTEKTVNSTL